jgi:surfeit locus 1 family protein
MKALKKALKKALMAPQRAALKGLIAPGLATALALAALVSLGNWQMQRLAWKEGIIGRMGARIHAAPQPLPAPQDWAALQPLDYEYRRVTANGVFDHAREVRVFHAAGGIMREPGWLVLTPLALPSGAQVIVNRGFVPLAKADPLTRPQGQLAGEVQVSGLMRAPEPRNPFTPADQPQKREWHVRDPISIAAHFELKNAAPFLIDADDADLPGGLPKGGATNFRIANNHFSYALTWYGLALTLLGVFAVFAWRRLRSPRAE